MIRLKSILRILAAAALPLAAGCSDFCRSDYASVDFGERWSVSRDVITFRDNAVPAAATKAYSETVDGTIRTSGFNVCAFLGTDTHMPVVHASWDASSERYLVDGSTRYYYPTEGNLKFRAAYGGTLSVSGSDAVLGWTHDAEGDPVAASSTGGARPTAFTFDHILSRLQVKCTGIDAAVRYRVTSVTVEAGAAGTYAFDGDAWQDVTGKATQTMYSASGGVILTEDAQAVGEAQSFIPGDVTVTVAWTCWDTGGEEEKCVGTYSRGTTVSLEKGKLNTIIAHLPNDEADIVGFSVAVSPWDAESDVSADLLDIITCSIESTYVIVDGGVWI